MPRFNRFDRLVVSNGVAVFLAGAYLYFKTYALVPPNMLDYLEQSVYAMTSIIIGKDHLHLPKAQI